MKDNPDRESDNISLLAEEWRPAREVSGKPEAQAGFHPFYIIPLLYVISVYLLPVFMVVMSQWEDAPVTYLQYLPSILGIANVINAIKFCRPENRIMLLNAAVMVKYALIPFFLVGGLLEVASVLFALIPVPFFVMVFGSLAILGVVGGWMIVVLGGAPYVIAYLRLASKAGLFPKWLAVLLGILQFFFGVDVVDVMILALRERRWVKLTLIVIGLVIFVVVLFVLLAILGVVSMVVAG